MGASNPFTAIFAQKRDAQRIGKMSDSELQASRTKFYNGMNARAGPRRKQSVNNYLTKIGSDAGGLNDLYSSEIRKRRSAAAKQTGSVATPIGGGSGASTRSLLG